MPDDLRTLAGELSLAAVRLKRQLRVRRNSSRVTLTQLSVLSTLGREGAMAPGSLAARERVQPPSMTRVVGSLERMELITRTRHATDRRQFLLELTDRGRAVIDEDARARDEWLSGRLDTLSDDQIETLRDATTIMTAIVDDADDE